MAKNQKTEETVSVQHIWYMTGQNPICTEPEKVPQYFIAFELEPGPHCQACLELITDWLNWWLLQRPKG